MKKIMILFGILILSSFVYAGITNPLPTELNLLQGESGRFKFQIQTIASNQALECTASVVEGSILDVEFDDEVVTVPAGSIEEIKGSVSVSDNLDFGNYQAEFCVSCRPLSEDAGTAVMIDTCDLPIKVNVVESRDKGNMTVENVKEFPMTTVIILGVIALAIILYLIWTRKPKKIKRNK